MAPSDHPPPSSPPSVRPPAAAKILGQTVSVARFRHADAFANDTGTAPIGMSSGDAAVRHRLSRAGNRQLNSALHLAAHVQRLHPGSGQDCDRRKIAEGDPD